MAVEAIPSGYPKTDAEPTGLEIMRLLDRLHPRFSLRRLANVAGPIGCRGVPDRAASREDADETDGDRGALSSSADHEARAGAQDLSLSAARDGDRPAEPSVGDGYHLHPDG